MTFMNIEKVTKDYDGEWMGAGWYAYSWPTNVRGRFCNHTVIEYIEEDGEMTEDYTDFVSDKPYAVAECETNGGMVFAIYFTDDVDRVEEHLTAMYYEDLRELNPGESFDMDDARELARLAIMEIDFRGGFRDDEIHPVFTDTCSAFFIN